MVGVGGWLILKMMMMIDGICNLHGEVGGDELHWHACEYKFTAKAILGDE